jgi:hypothetical protein
VRIAFTLDCCDREAIFSRVATSAGIDSGDICDLMIESVERRFGSVNRLPMPIEWLGIGQRLALYRTRDEEASVQIQSDDSSRRRSGAPHHAD